MSFNLNKNEEPAGSSKKSNFDLSKNDQVTDNQGSKKPPYWLFAAVALLVVGGGIWYLTKNDTSSKHAAGDTLVIAAPREVDVKPDTGLAVIGSDKAAKDSSGLQNDPSSADAAVTGRKPDVAGVGTPVAAAFFKAGSTSPQRTINSIPAAVRKKIKRGLAVKVIVIGYASSEGTLAANQSISQARADAYKSFLIQKGIAERNITAQGKGIENPVASNDTEAGRSKNRRVEVVFQ
jgi:outer membrane protein OmpA-like peptidoglycan-associated protein